MGMKRIKDEREAPLNDVARRIMFASNYDPHFAGIEERLTMETKLFLARWDTLMGLMVSKSAAELVHQQKYGDREWPPNIERLAEELQRGPSYAAPIPMILFCPKCGEQHVDRPAEGWDNPPHRSHLCDACNHVWRPADVPTTGVAGVLTVGKNDSRPPVRGRALRIAE